MLKNRQWSVHPANLMGYFREALLALVPIANKVHMPWKEPDNYDDWDTICSALYASIVARSVENAMENEQFFELLPYDKRAESYNENSFVGSSDLGIDHAFICLQTRSKPFDTCLFANLGPGGVVRDHVSSRFVDTNFTIVGRKVGSAVVLKNLRVIL